MKKIRNSNIEILRIISMLFIVVSHYTVHNGVLNSSLPIGLNRLLLEITTLGNIGVIIFVLITGYYMIKQKSFKLKKIVNLYFQVAFYSIIIYILFIILKLEPISIRGIIKSFIPITFGQYWFVTAYFLLYIFSPFINKFLNNLSRKEHLNFIIISIFIFSIVSTFTMQQLYGNEIIQFIIFYSMGAYLKKYPKNIFSENKKINKILLIITTLLLIGSVVIFDLFGKNISYTTYMFNRNSILSILFSLSLFNIFINKKSFTNNFINIIASCSFGVYLIHDNSLVRSVIWSNIFKNSNYIYSNFLIIHMLFTIIIVYIVCTIIEYIRKNTVEKLITKMLNDKIDKIQLYVEKKLNKIYLKFDIK